MKITAITAEVFSAYLQCPTKAYLLAVGDKVQDAFFSDLETQISLMYKASAELRLQLIIENAEIVTLVTTGAGL